MAVFSRFAAAILVAGSLASASVATAQAVPSVARPAAGSLDPAARGDDATLTGVSCLSRVFCEASGFYVALAEGGVVFGLNEVWNGHSWTNQIVPGLSTNSNVLDAIAISCGTTTMCMLVGEHYSNASRPVQFAEIAGGLGSPLIWNNPVGARSSLLDDVKCVGATFCMAVGTYSTTASRGRVLAQLWNGSSWHRLSPPSPAKSLNSVLGELSCLSASDCFALGVRETPARNFVSFAERWNGHGWRLSAVPSVRGERDTVLNDVSCTSPSVCEAVGFSGRPSTHPLVMRFSKGSWTTQRTPKVGTASFNSVACPSSTSCIAVGARGLRALAERWNGTRWILTAAYQTGLGYPDDNLIHVSCISTSHCVAVGIRYNARVRFNNHTLAEGWNGSTWQLQTSVNP